MGYFFFLAWSDGHLEMSPRIVYSNKYVFLIILHRDASGTISSVSRGCNDMHTPKSDGSFTVPVVLRNLPDWFTSPVMCAGLILKATPTSIQFLTPDFDVIFRARHIWY